MKAVILPTGVPSTRGGDIHGRAGTHRAAIGTRSPCIQLYSVDRSLALFLFGLGLMTDGLKAIVGARLQDLLGKLTANRFRGVLAGAGVTGKWGEAAAGMPLAVDNALVHSNIWTELLPEGSTST